MNLSVIVQLTTLKDVPVRSRIDWRRWTTIVHEQRWTTATRHSERRRRRSLVPRSPSSPRAPSSRWSDYSPDAAPPPSDDSSMYTTERLTV